MKYLKYSFGVLVLVLAIFGIYLWLYPLVLEKRFEFYIEERAGELYNSLTVEKRISQLFHIAIPGKAYGPKIEKILHDWQPGGLILFGANLGSREEIETLTQKLQEHALTSTGIPYFISTDQEGGGVRRVVLHEIDFPSAVALGQIGDPKLCEAIGFMTSYTLWELGINLFFAPVLDINSNPYNPVIGPRSFGSSLDQVLRCALPFERSARQGGALPVVKHFPGHGDTYQDSHWELPRVYKSWEELTNFELIPFLGAIEGGAEALMSAHILYPKIDAENPATISREIIGKKLRQDIGYSGLIFTDALEMKAISLYASKKNVAEAAIKAGIDILLLTSYGSYANALRQQLKRALKEGMIEHDLVAKAVQKQIRTKLRHAPSMFFDFAPDYVKDYLELREKKRLKTKLSWLNVFPQLPQEAASRAIRSLGRPFRRMSSPPSPLTVAVENHLMRQELEAYLGKDALFISKGQDLKSGTNIVIADSFYQKDLEKLYFWAMRYEKTQFFILHYGSPYLKFPKKENMSFLLSLSPNRESLRSLAHCLWGEGEIPSLELFLPQ